MWAICHASFAIIFAIKLTNFSRQSSISQSVNRVLVNQELHAMFSNFSCFLERFAKQLRHVPVSVFVSALYLWHSCLINTHCRIHKVFTLHVKVFAERNILG